MVAILGEVAFGLLSHNGIMTSDQTSRISHKADTYGYQYMESMSEFTVCSKISIYLSIQVGQWLNIFPHTRIHMALGKQEFHNNALISYQAWPKDLPEKCDVCATNKPFMIQDTLHWKSGGLFMGHQNYFRVSLALMETYDLSSYYVCDKKNTHLLRS